MKPFAFPENNCLDDIPDEEYFERPERIYVDVVADGGKSWIKVVARKPEALLASIMGKFLGQKWIKLTKYNQSTGLGCF